MDRLFAAFEQLFEALGEVIQKLIEAVIDAARNLADFLSAAAATILPEGDVYTDSMSRSWNYRRRGWFAFRYGRL